MPPAHTTDLSSYKKFPGGVHRRMVRLLSPAGVLYKFMEKGCNHEMPIQRTVGKSSASEKKIRNGENSGCLACRSCESSNLSHTGKEILPVGCVRRATGHTLSTGNIIVISIHALREESDACWFARLISADIFLSTLSVRRATADWMQTSKGALISIHALREESDTADKSAAIERRNFYPRSP